MGKGDSGASQPDDLGQGQPLNIVTTAAPEGNETEAPSKDDGIIV